MPDDRLPAQGARLVLGPAHDLPAVEILLDLERGLLHVLRDDDEARFEGRVALEPLDAARWAARLRALPPIRHTTEAPLARLSWRGATRPGIFQVAELDPHPAPGAPSAAVDLFRQALRLAVDHPRAAQLLSRWNSALRLEATVGFGEGRPRRIHLIGVVDSPGVRTLEALGAVLDPGEPVIVDASGCSSLGRWDPAALVQAHPVAWVGARGGVRARLEDQGVPEQAFHPDAGAARRWLRPS
jgi:hypothetical protein